MLNVLYLNARSKHNTISFDCFLNTNIIVTISSVDYCPLLLYYCVLLLLPLLFSSPGLYDVYFRQCSKCEPQYPINCDSCLL